MPKTGRHLPILGACLTLVWLASVGLYVSGQWLKVAVLAPDALANFAAGVCAPLAFLWLVLGFFQQGQELRHSGRALWLQGRELQQSVEQQRELVNVTREQLQFESSMLERQQIEIMRNSQPILRLREGGNVGAANGNRSYDFSVTNIGKPCTDVSIKDSNGVAKGAKSVLETGENIGISFDFAIGPVPRFEVIVSFMDQQLNQQQKKFSVSREDRAFLISDCD